jgi:outer membrane protease
MADAMNMVAASRGRRSLRSAGGHMDGMDWMDGMDPEGEALHLERNV